jgi:hypothetical protein
MAWAGPLTLSQGNFKWPLGVAVGAGFIAVADEGYENIQVFDNNGNYLYSITPVGAYPDLYGMAIDSYGELYSADYGDGEVDGYYLGPTSYTYDYTWTGQSALSGPLGVKIDANGNLVVADGNNANVYNLNWADDSILNQTGSTYLSDPQDVALDPSGNIYVGDWKNQIVEFDGGYNHLNSFTGSGWTTPLGTSVGVGVDSQGNLFIADFENSRVVYATTQGNYLGELDGFGYPAYLALDSADDLFVSDPGNYVVDEFTKQ